ncbi:hypothetical protein DMB66_57750 [Actinoplanes sp. ATCC 53533]|uniref:hypothetical protein n=1 Tax=Actinoplanes sp. ATCC 53533 TaxID=1288362 RepID=UPI000F79C42A|nr:hypothetical protein [Actinoplanes sp. ATCC 53533]RSM39930.1 hypothetical protein DMB66_57750 [Actinoplanes sp. ATCC 53533]
MRSAAPQTRGRGTTAAYLTVAATLSGALVATGTPPVWAGGTADRPALVSADKSPPQVRDVKFSRAAVSVRGLAVVPVRVSMRVTDPSGVLDNPHDMNPSPQLVLGSVPGHQAKLRPVLTRTSGTATDGTWSATVNVPSTWNGTVRIVSVGATDQAGNELSTTLSGARSPKLRVRGTHRPALTFNYSLLAGGGFRIHGRASFTDTGRPIGHRKLATGYDSGCDFDGGAVNTIVTDARGNYETRFRGGEAGAAGCVALIGPAARNQRPAILAYRVASAPAYSVPAAAMLQPEDLNGADTTTVTDNHWSALRPPQPCGPYASAKLRRADRAVQAMIGTLDQSRPTVIVNDVATYAADGAQRYLRDVRKAVATCGNGWSVLASGVAGDESVLLRHREYLDYAQTNKDTYIVVARTGRAVVVLADTGWETGSGHEDLVRSLSAAAVRRAAVVNGR